LRRIFIPILILLTILGCKTESDTELTIGDIELISKIEGQWIHKDNKDIYLTIKDGAEEVGVLNGQLLSRAEFKITSVNLDASYIVIDGLREYVSYDNGAEEEEFRGKIVLIKDGHELLYIHHHLDQEIRSEWIK